MSLSQEEIQKKFETYNFEGDDRWKEFVANDLKGELPNNADQKVINDIKKLWYKSVVDPDFETGLKMDDIPKQEGSINENNDQGQSNKEKSEENKEKTQKPPQNPLANCSKKVIYAFHLENLFKAIFMSSTVYFSRFSHYLGLLICIMAIIRQLKRPKWNREYAAKLVKNEFAHNLFYMVIYSIFSSYRNLVYFIPLMMHFWLGLCEYFNIQQGKIYEKCKRVIDLTRNNKQKLLLNKAKVEIAMVGWHILMLFISPATHQNILIIVFYVNFLRLKYMISMNLQVAFYEINEWGEKNLASEESNKLVRWTYKKIQQLCSYLVTFKKSQDKKPDSTKQEQ